MAAARSKLSPAVALSAEAELRAMPVFSTDSLLYTRQQGFTLLELIVVVFIIAIIATFAVASLDRDPVDLVEEEARRLHALLQLASEEAVLQSRELAIQFHRDGYQFMQLESNGDQWRWMPLSGDRILRPRCLPEMVHMEVTLEGEEALLSPMGCVDGAAVSATLDAEDEEEKADNRSLRDEEEAAHPRIFLLSSGEMTPFEIVMPVEHGGDAYRITGQMHGELRYLSPGEDADEV